MSIYQRLSDYLAADMYPMHMPGHKRTPPFSMPNPYELDVTEVEGLDDLHHPTGMFRELMEQMKQAYRTSQTYLLTNGSTCGILAAISSCVRRGDTIIMARNCHRSVYHAVYLWELHPVYLYPKTDEHTGIPLEITEKQVRRALAQCPAASCVVLTSPTYEGVVSDIREIAVCAHEKNVPLIVDEAHGAHFAWGNPVWDKIPAPAMWQGADLVAESLHKTLPSLTQTAVLHLCSDRIEDKRIERYLDIYESSSPSYLLTASAGQCMDWMENSGRQAFFSYQDNLEKFRERAEHWQRIFLWEHPKKEPSKLVIAVREGMLPGYALGAILRERYRIQAEMETEGYVLAMTSICDRREGWERLSEALLEIDGDISLFSGDSVSEHMPVRLFPPYGVSGEVQMSLYAALNGPSRSIPLADSVGETAAEYVYLYPPGIPVLVPGEQITREAAEWIVSAQKHRTGLRGLEDESGEHIRVVQKKPVEK